jgi:hypothetical protein
VPQLVIFLKWEALIFLGGLAGIVVVQLLTGQINTDGLFRADQAGSGGKNSQFSPARVQLLISTLGAAVYYLSQVLANPTPGTFPPLPAAWPALVGGSNLLYLGGKAYARWFGQKNTN